MEIPRYWRNKNKYYKDLGPGIIYSYTDTIAIVEFEDGKRITAQLTDFDREPKIGEAVECVTRRWKEDPVNGDPDHGLIIYGYKFRPPISSSSK